MLHCFDRAKLLLVLLVFCGQQVLSQNNTMSDNQLWLKADKALEQGDFLTAKNLYDKLYASDSASAELNYKLGLSNFYIRKYRMFSKHYFEKANTLEFPETYYYLGLLNHLLRNDQLAVEQFTKYKNGNFEKEHSVKEIDVLIEKSNTAKLFELQGDHDLQIENLGNSINTEFAEYAPLIPVQEDFLIFTSRRKNEWHSNKDPFGEYFEDIYLAFKFGDAWQDPEVLDTTINTSLHDACTGLSADGEKLFIYRTSKNLSGGDIYESSLNVTKFSKPVLLSSDVNSKEYLETSACYTPDNNVIFFSSNRPGGYGGMDLYMMKKLPNGTWAAPFNLGPSINTPYNEDASFVHPSGGVLFFSSEGHQNMGGYDIFKSNFDEDANFTAPQNMGYPINTRDDDVFFVLNADATVGYFSSEREGGYGSQDIYKVKFAPNPLPLNVYTARVIDENNNVIKRTEFTITDLSAKRVYGVYKSNDLTGKIIIISEPNKEYQLTIRAAGYEPFITTIILNADNDLSYRLTTHTQ